MAHQIIRCSPLQMWEPPSTSLIMASWLQVITIYILLMTGVLQMLSQNRRWLGPPLVVPWCGVKRSPMMFKDLGCSFMCSHTMSCLRCGLTLAFLSQI